MFLKQLRKLKRGKSFEIFPVRVERENFLTRMEAQETRGEEILGAKCVVRSAKAQIVASSSLWIVSRAIRGSSVPPRSLNAQKHECIPASLLIEINAISVKFTSIVVIERSWIVIRLRSPRKLVSRWIEVRSEEGKKSGFDRS